MLKRWCADGTCCCETGDCESVCLNCGTTIPSFRGLDWFSVASRQRLGRNLQTAVKAAVALIELAVKISVRNNGELDGINQCPDSQSTKCQEFGDTTSMSPKIEIQSGPKQPGQDYGRSLTFHAASVARIDSFRLRGPSGKLGLPRSKVAATLPLAIPRL